MHSLIIYLLLGILLIPSCKSEGTGGKVDFSKFDHKETLEISPDRWLDIYFDRANQGFVFEWNGKIVRKKIAIKYNDEGEMLLSLREKDGVLYMIFLNRIDIHRITYDFYKLSDDGREFVQIEPKDYPKDIATQNRIFASFNKGRDRYGNPVDDFKLLTELDVENVYFTFLSTAGIWICIEKGLQYYELPDQEEKHAIIKEYKHKYKPIALKNLVREDAKQ